MKNGICHYCEEEAPLTRDHVVPKSKIEKWIANGKPFPDGFSPENNIVWACAPCNVVKGTKEYNSFKQLGVKQIRHLKLMHINKTMRRK